MTAAAPPLTALQNAYFVGGMLFPLSSAPLYLFVPSGTVKFFGGKPTPSAAFWCSLAAGGDILFAYLCYTAWRSKSLEVRKLVFRANAIFRIFHFGGFLFHHLFTEPHPAGYGVGYAVAMTLGLLAGFVWG